MLPPQEIAILLQARFRELGYAPDESLFRVTVEDVITVLTQRLIESGTGLSDYRSQISVTSSIRLPNISTAKACCGMRSSLSD